MIIVWKSVMIYLVGALWYTCHTTGCRINRNDRFIFWIVYGFFVSTLSTIPFLNGSNVWQHLQRRLALPIFLPQWRHAFERCFAFWPGCFGGLSGTGCGASVKTNWQSWSKSWQSWSKSSWGSKVPWSFLARSLTPSTNAGISFGMSLSMVDSFFSSGVDMVVVTLPILYANGGCGAWGLEIAS